MKSLHYLGVGIKRANLRESIIYELFDCRAGFHFSWVIDPHHTDDHIIIIESTIFFIQSLKEVVVVLFRTASCCYFNNDSKCNNLKKS